MATIPVLGFAAFSGTGKTTLIEEILPRLKERGLRVAVLKHDVHRVVLDHEGKDSWRFAEAGADMTVVSSDEKTAILEQRTLTFENLLSLVHDVDLVLVEGFKGEPVTQIGIERKEKLKCLPDALSRYVAIVTDSEHPSSDVPEFRFEEVEEITEYILCHMNEFTHFDERGRLR